MKKPFANAAAALAFAASAQTADAQAVRFANVPDYLQCEAQALNIFMGGGLGPSSTESSAGTNAVDRALYFQNEDHTLSLQWREYATGYTDSWILQYEIFEGSGETSHRVQMEVLGLERAGPGNFEENTGYGERPGRGGETYAVAPYTARRALTELNIICARIS